MKNRKNIVIVSIIVGILIVGSFLVVILKNNKSVADENTNNEVLYENEGQEIINFFNAIVGVKAENIEIINTPVIGFKGKLLAPEESIVNGLNYFLEKTNNSKITNPKIEIENNNIDIYVNYEVTKNITTPIKVSINPIIDENRNLVINISEVKILDLKLADFLVNLALKTFVKDWFNDTNMKVEYGNNSVVIYSENFTGIELEDITLKDEGISLYAIIDIEKFTK